MIALFATICYWFFTNFSLQDVVPDIHQRRQIRYITRERVSN